MTMSIDVTQRKFGETPSEFQICCYTLTKSASTKFKWITSIIIQVHIWFIREPKSGDCSYGNFLFSHYTNTQIETERCHDEGKKVTVIATWLKWILMQHFTICLQWRVKYWMKTLITWDEQVFPKKWKNVILCCQRNMIFQHSFHCMLIFFFFFLITLPDYQRFIKNKMWNTSDQKRIRWCDWRIESKVSNKVSCSSDCSFIWNKWLCSMVHNAAH